MSPNTKSNGSEANVTVKFFTAGVSACIADAATFPLDVAKVKLQIQGEAAGGKIYSGMLNCITKIVKNEGPKALYKGIIPGLHRQMCFASVRIGLYDFVKEKYSLLLTGSTDVNQSIGLRIIAGITTGGLAVIFAQPTDVVKVRFQAQAAGIQRYKGCIDAYYTIGKSEGLAGLWKGTLPNMARNAVVNACELVSYDLIKQKILAYNLLSDNVPCHFVSAFSGGFITTCFASPIDVVKTRYMNSDAGRYKGVVNCAVSMFRNEGAMAFYKGFWPSFMRLGSWNIVMFVSYEQLKRIFTSNSYYVNVSNSSKVKSSS